MRLGFVAGAAALLIGIGALDANAMDSNAMTLGDEASAKLAAGHRQHLQPFSGARGASAAQEARAADSGVGYRGARRDDPYRRPTDNGYHDPRFSLQQDEIYNGRF